LLLDDSSGNASKPTVIFFKGGSTEADLLSMSGCFLRPGRALSSEWRRELTLLLKEALLLATLPSEGEKDVIFRKEGRILDMRVGGNTDFSLDARRAGAGKGT
jgi:hypothetical protein